MSDLMAPNATQLERELAAMPDRLEGISAPISTLFDARTCPEDLLPWLAWAVSVDAWDSRWPIAIRREVVAMAIAQHRHKGTPASMRAALEALGLEVELSEWWQHGGEPYTFRVKARPVLDLIGDETLPFLSLELRDHVEGVIERVKPARAHCDLVWLLSYSASYSKAAAAAVHARKRAGVDPTQRPTEYSGSRSYAAATAAHARKRAGASPIVSVAGTSSRALGQGAIAAHTRRGAAVSAVVSQTGTASRSSCAAVRLSHVIRANMEISANGN